MDFDEVLKAYNESPKIVQNITGLSESNPIELLSSDSSSNEAKPPQNSEDKVDAMDQVYQGIHFESDVSKKHAESYEETKEEMPVGQGDEDMTVSENSWKLCLEESGESED